MPLKCLKGAKLNESINILAPDCMSHYHRRSLALEIPSALFSLYVFNGKLSPKSSINVSDGGTLLDAGQGLGLRPRAGPGLRVPAVDLSRFPPTRGDPGPVFTRGHNPELVLPWLARAGITCSIVLLAPLPERCHFVLGEGTWK